MAGVTAGAAMHRRTSLEDGRAASAQYVRHGPGVPSSIARLDSPRTARRDAERCVCPCNPMLRVLHDLRRHFRVVGRADRCRVRSISSNRRRIDHRTRAGARCALGLARKRRQAKAMLHGGEGAEARALQLMSQGSGDRADEQRGAAGSSHAARVRGGRGRGRVARFAGRTRATLSACA